jgi:hypothetical protein
MIGGEEISALLDTGCEITILNEQLYNKLRLLGLNCLELPTQHLNLVSALNPGMLPEVHLWRIEGRRHLCTDFGPHQRHLYPVVLALVRRIKSWLVVDTCVI